MFEFFSLSKVGTDDKFNITLTVTNRDCSNNLQETLQLQQSKVSKRKAIYNNWSRKKNYVRISSTMQGVNCGINL